MDTEISEKRKNLVLFILDAVVFGLAIAALSWAFPISIPEKFAPFILILSFLFLFLLAILTFKLLVSPIRIKENISCILIQNMKEGSICIMDPVWYDFSVVGAEAFSQLIDKKPEYKEKMLKALELRGNILKDFSVFAIIEWLKKSGSTSIPLSGYGRRYSPIIFEGKMEAGHLPRNVVEENIFLKTVESPFPLSVPKNSEIRVENGAVILSCSFMTITIAITFYSWLHGIDLRLQNVIDISEEEKKNCGTISGLISFDAKFSFRSIFSPRPDRYYAYAKNLLKNLRFVYGGSEFIELVKDSAFWKHVLNHK